jgi:hydrogenase maturation protein HypF
LEEADTYAAYVSNIKHMESLLGIVPEMVCCDLHPGYASTRYAHGLGLEVREVQHHYAHIASVMADQGICEEVIGIAYDGTGYGTDGKIWGGEFLLCGLKEFKRVAHLEYVPMLGGDASIAAAWKSAYMYLYRAGLETCMKREEAEILRAAVSKDVNMLESSSIGRLFDAVSSILDIKHSSSYEGECAILLENKAAQYAGKSGKMKPYDYDIIYDGEAYNIRVLHCIRDIVEEKAKGTDTSLIAYRFHNTAAAFTAEICRLIRDKYCINKVALSGGVFQNSLLSEMVTKELAHSGFKVFMSRSVPQNDGGIALGQAFASIMG